MRLFYNLMAYLMYLPFTAYWLVRAIGNPSYRQKIGQRFGFSYPNLEKSLWIHAVSVGEVVAAEPLIKALLQRFPDRPLLVTTVTPTGAARAKRVFGDRIHHSYIPFETPFAVNRFFRSVDPKIALILETEIWPNLYEGCGVRKIPLVLVSARISSRSVKSYRRLLPLLRETLSHGIFIAAQSRTDAERFISLGANADRTRVTGNIKFDIELEPGIREKGADFRRRTFGDRPVWIAASTHEGEEQLVLDAHKSLLNTHPDVLLLLVPRHPERFAQVAELIRRNHLSHVSRTAHRPCESTDHVFLGNTMGEMMMFYGASDIAFVAGSLVPIGGHNLLEPSAMGLPIVFGPHYFNAPDIAELFISNSACRLVQDVDELAGTISELIQDPGLAGDLGEKAKDIVARNRGSLSQLLEVVTPLIEDQG
ncbi:MAG: lipid IV(A) 3-deoxy-D-manno-octulosonic acid transferase [Woeseiaceae bacterium]|nr:lipid IV(A) 3-deoxy-D-manno-octulosonic acid transferase [Woeseiaceae bacterium]